MRPMCSIPTDTRLKWFIRVDRFRQYLQIGEWVMPSGELPIICPTGRAGLRGFAALIVPRSLGGRLFALQSEMRVQYGIQASHPRIRKNVLFVNGRANYTAPLVSQAGIHSPTTLELPWDCFPTRRNNSASGMHISDKEPNNRKLSA
jgi:hypothetical protein